MENPGEIVSDNWYISNRLMITSGEFWRCKHGITKFMPGCMECKAEVDETNGLDDTKRLDWMLENHANVETDGAGNWRVAFEWTNPETYFPYASNRRAAIDAAIRTETPDE